MLRALPTVEPAKTGSEARTPEGPFVHKLWLCSAMRGLDSWNRAAETAGRTDRALGCGGQAHPGWTGGDPPHRVVHTRAATVGGAFGYLDFRSPKERRRTTSATWFEAFNPNAAAIVPVPS